MTKPSSFEIDRAGSWSSLLTFRCSNISSMVLGVLSSSFSGSWKLQLAGLEFVLVFVFHFA